MQFTVDVCQPLGKQLQDTHFVERLGKDSVYERCGSCANFHCIQETSQESLLEQKRQIHQLMGDYVKASSQFLVNSFLFVAMKSDCHRSGPWPCTEKIQLETVVDQIRKFKISHDVQTIFGKKTNDDPDIVAIRKHVYLATTLLDPEYLDNIQKHIRKIVVKDKTLEFDSMYAYRPKKISFKNSVLINDSFRHSNNLSNVTGVWSFVATLHEFGHFLDQELTGKKGKLVSETQEWQEALKHGSSVSFYSIFSHDENFAESFAAYLLDPLFQCYTPERYAYFNKNIKINSEVYEGEKPFSKIECTNEFIQSALKYRDEILKMGYDRSELAKGDDQPLRLSGEIQKKNPGAPCSQDSFCENQQMGCDKKYVLFTLGKIGRCRALPGTTKNGGYCDVKEECESNSCQKFKCE